MKAHIQKCRKLLKLFRIFSNIHDFSDFFEVFRIELFTPAEPSHVLCIKRFAIKFHVGLSICGHWASLSKNSFIPKTAQKWGFTRVKIAWVHSKSNKPTPKSISESPDSSKLRLGKRLWETTHAYECYLRNYKFLSQFLKPDFQGICSKFLYHQIQHLLLSQKTYFDTKKSH